MAEFVERYDNKIQRILEIIPGVMTWAFLLSPIWLGLIYPQAIIYLLTFLTVYWAYLAIQSTIGLVLGHQRFKKEMSENWYEKCLSLDFSQLPDKETLPSSLEDTKHFILIPVVNESYRILNEAFTALLNQTLPTKTFTIVYTVEEKYAEATIETIKQVIKDKEDKFEKILIFTHPAGIVGEAVGAGAANRTWGAKRGVEYLQNNKISTRNFVFSTLDADHVVDVQYFARLTHLYLSSDTRDNHFYTTAMHLFNNNLWQASVMARIEANFVTLGTLGTWALSESKLSWLLGESPVTKDTFASYSSSLDTLIAADYWDVAAGVDDSVFFWRAFFARKGRFTGLCHYIPYSADAVEAESHIQAHKSLYKQLLRWGWGIITFPMSVKGFMKHKEVPFEIKLRWMLKYFKIKTLLVSISFLITFGFAMLTFVNANVKQTSFAYSLPHMASIILTSALLLIIPGTIYRYKLTKAVPENWPFWKKTLAFLEGTIVIINLLTYSFIPFIDAQTRMMLGKKMKDLYHTPKVRN